MDHSGGIDPSAADDLDRLSAWAAEIRVDEAVDQRRRAAWLHRQAGEESTLSGVLVDLAEHGRSVTVRTSVGHRHRGRLVLVGLDVVGLRSFEGVLLLARLDAITSVRPQPGTPLVTGDERLDATITLRGEMGKLSRDRPRLVVTTSGEEALVGTLMGVGRDVATMAIDAGGKVYVALGSVVEVSVPESG